MRTVKEISELTGVSARTIHYYDEIGLLRPTEKNEAGYRFYDDKALETLQQILFFREFDIPLKNIKALMDDPSLDRDQILQMQRKMLVSKKERIERLIVSIDDILRGENKMDFEVFNKSEIGEMCEASIERMPDFMRENIIEEFGSLEQWKNHYMDRASKADMQQGYQKLVEWYGDKQRAWQSLINPPSPEAGEACVKKAEAILEKLAEKKECPKDSPAVNELIAAYGLLMKEFTQMKCEEGVMLSTASSYRDEIVKHVLDEKYGEGAAEFFAQAIEAFYNKGER